jgi:surfactin synthase thioesterase subunit
MTKRIELAESLEQRDTYTATYQGRSKPGKRPNIMLLFIDVKDKEGKVVTNHLWFNQTQGFLSLRLIPGDHVQFEARVKTYQRKNNTIDYRLSYPTKIKLI